MPSQEEPPALPGSGRPRPYQPAHARGTPRRPSPGQLPASAAADLPGSTFFDRTDDDAPVEAVDSVNTVDSAAGAADAPSSGPSRRTRMGLKAAVGAGIGVFAVAAFASALPGTGAAPHRARTTAADAHHPLDILPSATTPAAVDVARLPVIHAKQQAPANKAVITGLAANGIPRVALNAYRVAAARMASAQPSCGIGWWLLAGIGRVESDHGRFGGATLNPDGTSTPKIIGPALTGTGNEYIPAPPNGMALDGDAVYTHALGPMQFIPQTWAGYGTDANGDGKADIFNINDAALSAARYLCAAGGNLHTLAGREAAVLAYNHSTAYLNQVLALAEAYRAGVPVSGVPVGDTSGALPPLRQTGPIPPANPGPPTAVRTGKYSAGSGSGSSGGSSGGGTLAGGNTSGGSGSGGSGGTGGTGGGGTGGGGTGGSAGGGATSPAGAATSAVPKPTRSSSLPSLPLPTLTPLPSPTKTTSAKPSPTTSKSTCILDPILHICL